MSEVSTPPTRLVDLNPKWVKVHGTDEIYGISYNCPCRKPGSIGEEGNVDVCPMGGWSVVPTKTNFAGGESSADAKARGWDLTGDSFENVTLAPSIHHVGHWHGFLTNGVLISC